MTKFPHSIAKSLLVQRTTWYLERVLPLWVDSGHNCVSAGLGAGLALPTVPIAEARGLQQGPQNRQWFFSCQQMWRFVLLLGASPGTFSQNGAKHLGVHLKTLWCKGGPNCSFTPPPLPMLPSQSVPHHITLHPARVDGGRRGGARPLMCVSLGGVSMETQTRCCSPQQDFSSLRDTTQTHMKGKNTHQIMN